MSIVLPLYPQLSTVLDIEHVHLLMNEFVGMGRGTSKLPKMCAAK